MKVVKSGMYLVALLAGVGAFSVGASAELDTTFGNNAGYVTTNISATEDSNDYANSVMRLTNGELLVSGQSDGNVVVVSYDSAGSLDSSFANNGVLETGIAAIDDLGTPLALQGNEAFYVAGVENNNFIVARYLVNGSLDDNFADMGYFRNPLSGVSSELMDMSFDNDGDLVLFGGFNEVGATGVEGGLVLKINAGGELVTNFGTDGVVQYVANDGYAGFYAGTVQQDGKILAAGITQGSNFNSILLVARFNSDGALDSSFAQAGVFTLNESSNDDDHSALAVKALSTGNIVATGYGDYGAESGGLILSLTSSGVLDANFGSNGILFSDTYEDGVVRSFNEDREHLVFAGMNFADVDSPAYLLRTDLNGNVDSEFGMNGAFLLPEEIESVGNGQMAYFEGAYFLASGDKDTFNEVGDITLSKILDTNFVAEPTLVEFELTTTSIMESAGELIVNVVRSGSLSGTSLVDFQVSSGSAIESSDFTATNGTLEFAPGETSQSISISIVDDTIFEQTENFSVTLTNIVDAVIGTNSTLTVTVRDDDNENEDTPSSGGGSFHFIAVLILFLFGSRRSH